MAYSHNEILFGLKMKKENLLTEIVWMTPEDVLQVQEDK